MNTSREWAEMTEKMFVGQKQHAVRAKFNEMAEEFSIVNVELSLKLAKRYRCKIKECYNNCAKIAMADDRYQYVEGYAMSIIVVEHAWLVNENGEIVDPTWIRLDHGISNDYFGVRVPIDKLELNGFSPGWLKYVLEKLEVENGKRAAVS